MKYNGVCIIGLGYVGLPLACLVSGKGYKTFGFDSNPRIVELVNLGKSHIKDTDLEKKVRASEISASTDESVIASAEVIVVCVPTPVDKNDRPDLTPVAKASESISRNMVKGKIIIIESTIYPGVTEEFVKPILEKSGLKAGVDFFLAHCPERVDPGNREWPLEKLPRVIGGYNAESLDAASGFYESLGIKVKEMSSLKAAEAVKITENTFRDVNIAFVNELAKSFDLFGIDVKEVIEGASTKPFGFMPHYPGCGVGGHCIPVDPYYLIEKAHEKGFDHRFLKLAREINRSMPEFCVQKAVQGLRECGLDIKGAKVALWGLSYKQNIDDVRESPSFAILKLLNSKGAKVVTYDPQVASDASSISDSLKGADCVVIATAHREFVDYNFEKGEVKVIADGRNCLDKEKIKSKGIIYKGIGRQ